MEELFRGFAVEAAKQGFVVLGLLIVVGTLWRDNLALRRQIVEERKAREERDDGRFDEVRKLAEQCAGALVQGSSAAAAQGVSLAKTHDLIEKQGALLEARTAVFNTITAAALVNEERLKGLKEAIEAALRRLELR